MQRQQWWISIGDKPDGPHDREWILKALESGRISGDQLACPVGGGEWRPIRSWPEFSEQGGPPPPPPRVHSEPHPQSATAESLFTNPQLPPLGNAICVYAMLVSPVLWGMYNLSCCVSPDFFISSAPPDTPEFTFNIASTLIETTWGLIVTVALFIGGLRLRSLRQSGATILKATLWANFIFYFLFVVGFAVIYMIIPTETPVEPTSAEMLIEFFTSIMGIAELAFQIVSLIWLHRIGSMLPLTAD